MGTIDRGASTAQVAKMLASRFEKSLNGTCAAAASVEKDVSPLFGIRWARSIASAFDSRWVNRLLAFARNAPPRRRTYKSTASLLNGALSGDFSFPHSGEWRILSERFRLEVRYALKKLRPVLNWSPLLGWFRPSGLSVLSFTGIHMSAQVLPGPIIATDPWRDALLAYASAAEGAEIMALRGSHRS